MGSTKEEQDRVRNLLLDTVTLLCKNGLNFKQQLKVQGLLGITLDDDSVFIVHINEQVGEAVPEKKDVEESSDQSSIDSRRSSRDSQTTPYKNRKRTADTSPVFRGPPEKIKVKMEKEDTDEDLILLHDENDIDDKSHLKAQMLHQQQANVPSVTNIHSGFSQFNPQNNMHQPGGPFISGVSGTHTMTPLTPGGTPEKQLDSYAASLWMPRSQRRNIPIQEKEYVCDQPGCGLAYNIKSNLLRHQSLKHGRKNIKRCRGSGTENFAAEMQNLSSIGFSENVPQFSGNEGEFGESTSSDNASQEINERFNETLSHKHDKAEVNNQNFETEASKTEASQTLIDEVKEQSKLSLQSYDTGH